MKKVKFHFPLLDTTKHTRLTRVSKLGFLSLTVIKTYRRTNIKGWTAVLNFLNLCIAWNYIPLLSSSRWLVLQIRQQIRSLVCKENCPRLVELRQTLRRAKILKYLLIFCWLHPLVLRKWEIIKFMRGWVPWRRLNKAMPHLSQITSYFAHNDKYDH